MGPFYYARLEEEEQNIYSQIVKKLANYKDVKKGKYRICLKLNKYCNNDLMTRYLKNVVCSIRKDYPEFFYVNMLEYWMIWDKDNYYIEMDALYSVNKITEIKRKIEIEKRKIINEVKAKTIQETELNLYKYLQKSIKYKKTGGMEEITLVGCLINRECICEGVAHSVSYLFRELGISCITVFGTVKQPFSGNEGGHAWNMVQIGPGRKGIKCLDLTYDLSGSRRDYFNLTTKELSIDHIADIELPVCG